LVAGVAEAEGDSADVFDDPVVAARTLPLPDEVVDVLRAARKRQAEERLAFGLS